jgi:hypothetical protein
LAAEGLAQMQIEQEADLQRVHEGRFLSVVRAFPGGGCAERPGRIRKKAALGRL